MKLEAQVSLYRTPDINKLYWLTGFRGEDFKTFFPIGSYVKIMSAEGGHLDGGQGHPTQF